MNLKAIATAFGHRQWSSSTILKVNLIQEHIIHRYWAVWKPSFKNVNYYNVLTHSSAVLIAKLVELDSQVVLHPTFPISIPWTITRMLLQKLIPILRNWINPVIRRGPAKWTSFGRGVYEVCPKIINSAFISPRLIYFSSIVWWDLS